MGGKGEEGKSRLVARGVIASVLAQVLGFGVDPSVQIDVLTELQLGDSVAGVLQVQGLHNGSKAFFFQGTRHLSLLAHWAGSTEST